MSRFCTDCGAGLEPGVRFCSSCGAAVGEGAGAAAAQTVALPAPGSAPVPQAGAVPETGSVPTVPALGQPALDPAQAAPVPAQTAPQVMPVMYVPVYQQPYAPIPAGPRVRLPASVIIGGILGILAGLTAWLGPATMVRLVSVRWTPSRSDSRLLGEYLLGGYGRDWVGLGTVIAVSLLVVVCAGLVFAGFNWSRVALIAYAILVAAGAILGLAGGLFYSSSDWLWLISAIPALACALVLVLPPSNRFFAQSAALRFLRRAGGSSVAGAAERRGFPNSGLSRFAAALWLVAITLHTVPLLLNARIANGEFFLEPVIWSWAHITFVIVTGLLWVVGVWSAIQMATGRSWARPFLIALYLPSAVNVLVSVIQTVASFGWGTWVFWPTILWAFLFVVALLLSCIPPTNRYLRAKREEQLRRQVPYMFEV